MGHRHFSNSFNMFEMDQGLNSNHLTAEQPYVHMGRVPENGSFAYPTDNMLSSEVHCSSRWNLDGREYEYPSSSLSAEVSHIHPAFSGPYYDFPHSSATGNLYLAQENNAGHAHCNFYSRHATHEIEGNPRDPITGPERGPFKRKSPHVACERGSTNRFYSAGSSSGSSELLQEKPPLDYQNFGQHIGLPHYRAGSLSVVDEDSSRNVRSRSRLDLGSNPLRANSSGYFSHHYHSRIHPTNYSGVESLTNMNADEATSNWNSVPLPSAAHGALTSDTSGLGHVSRGSAAEIGGYYHYAVSGGNHVSSSHYPRGPPIEAAREGHGSYTGSITASYMVGTNVPRLVHETAASESGLQPISETYSSRHSRPSSSRGWRNSYRSGRSRIAIERFQSISSVMEPHHRVGSEAVMMVDRSSFYAGSRNLFDQYRDLRLDVDNMSYEELLALGERIGNVNTGLSEDMILKCLSETAYCSLDENNDEGTCSICLEEYKNGEEVGTMENCGHNYHAGCIRKWLTMKKVCPICKAPALKDCLQGE